LRADIEISNKKQPQKKSILSDDFWAKLNKLYITVKLIYKLQKKSEANKAILREVILR